MPIVECEQCGESSDLSGARVDGGISITCNRCGNRWLRDTEPSCSVCGSPRVHQFKEPLIQRARGNAYSIVGQKTIYLCVGCDADEIQRRTPSQEVERRPPEDFWK